MGNFTQIWDLLADLQVHCSNEAKGWTNQNGFFGIFLFRRCPFWGGVHCSLICHMLLWERTESFVFRCCGLTPGSSKSPLLDHILTPKPEGFYLWRCSMKSRIENLKVGEHVFDHVIILSTSDLTRREHEKKAAASWINVSETDIYHRLLLQPTTQFAIVGK